MIDLGKSVLKKKKCFVDIPLLRTFLSFFISRSPMEEIYGF